MTGEFVVVLAAEEKGGAEQGEGGFVAALALAFRVADDLGDFGEGFAGIDLKGENFCGLGGEQRDGVGGLVEKALAGREFAVNLASLARLYFIGAEGCGGDFIGHGAAVGHPGRGLRNRGGVENGVGAFEVGKAGLQVLDAGRECRQDGAQEVF